LHYRTYAGCVYIEIEATYEAEAKEIAHKNITLDNIQLWGCYDKIFDGHCMHTPLYETKIIGGNMNVREIIENWLKENGYDGLYYPDECACTIHDLMPCHGSQACDCEPGYEHPGDEESPFYIKKEKYQPK